MKLQTPSNCPLCSSTEVLHYHQDKRRNYYQCKQCSLVFVDPQALPSAAIEKAEYDLHNNDVNDPGYLQFLQRVTTPLLARLTPLCEGLDFGCGPGPALKSIMERQGHKVSLFDPFYFPNTLVLERQYDFVTCTEAIEHFHYPAQQWKTLLDVLAPGGWLAIMTKRVIDSERFATWHYKNDQTHVSFFSQATFDFLATRDGLQAEYLSNDVVMLQKRKPN